MATPTEQAYSELQHAYDVFNTRLFAGQLPPCLITMQPIFPPNPKRQKPVK